METTYVIIGIVIGIVIGIMIWYYYFKDSAKVDPTMAGCYVEMGPTCTDAGWHQLKKALNEEQCTSQAHVKIAECKDLESRFKWNP